MKKILLSSAVAMMLGSSAVFAAGSSSIDAMMGGYAYGNEANTSGGFCAGSGSIIVQYKDISPTSGNTIPIVAMTYA
jgi:hypothetical protein